MNPIVKAREATGLNRQRFAVALGVSYNVVAAHEAGYPLALTLRMREGLKLAGCFDVERIARDYAAWRVRQQADALKALAK